MLEKMGAAIVRADRLGHEVLTLPELKTELRRHFGDGIFDENDEIVRPRLGKIVFEQSESGREAKKILESLTHPEIGELIRREFEIHEKAGKRILVLDAPLLLEGNWDKLCNAVLFIEAFETVRRERAMKRGWTSEEFAARESSQIPLETKRRCANWVVFNDGTEEECREQLQNIVDRIENAPP